MHFNNVNNCPKCGSIIDIVPFLLSYSSWSHDDVIDYLIKTYLQFLKAIMALQIEWVYLETLIKLSRKTTLNSLIFTFIYFLECSFSPFLNILSRTHSISSTSFFFPSLSIRNVVHYWSRHPYWLDTKSSTSQIKTKEFLINIFFLSRLKEIKRT